MIADSEGTDQTARMPSLIWAFRCPHMPQDTFSHDMANIMYYEKMKDRDVNHGRITTQIGQIVQSESLIGSLALCS